MEGTSYCTNLQKKGHKTDCNNYHRISLLSTSYQMLPIILVSRLSPYKDEIIGGITYGFRRSR
jgi:hypothetical protein